MDKLRSVSHQRVQAAGGGSRGCDGDRSGVLGNKKVEPPSPRMLSPSGEDIVRFAFLRLTLAVRALVHMRKGKTADNKTF